LELFYNYLVHQLKSIYTLNFPNSALSQDCLLQTKMEKFPIRIKQEANGEILSGTSKTITLLALDNYIDYCVGSWITSTFSFGLTEDGAKYNQNWIYINYDFNFSPNTNNKLPFTWESSVNSPNKDVFTTDVTPENETIFYVDSNSASFVY